MLKNAGIEKQQAPQRRHGAVSTIVQLLGQ